MGLISIKYAYIRSGHDSLRRQQRQQYRVGQVCLPLVINYQRRYNRRHLHKSRNNYKETNGIFSTNNEIIETSQFPFTPFLKSLVTNQPAPQKQRKKWWYQVQTVNTTTILVLALLLSQQSALILFWIMHPIYKRELVSYLQMTYCIPSIVDSIFHSHQQITIWM